MIVLIPFGQLVVGRHGTDPLAYAVYGSVLTALAVVDTAMRAHAYRAGLLSAAWTVPKLRSELIRGAVVTIGFVATVVLAPLLIAATPLVWLLIFGLDRVLLRFLERRAAARRPDPPPTRS